MRIAYKVVMVPDVVCERVIRDVDYISIGKRSLSYRLRGKESWLHTLRFDSVSHIRILEDDNFENYVPIG